MSRTSQTRTQNPLSLHEQFGWLDLGDDRSVNRAATAPEPEREVAALVGDEDADATDSEGITRLMRAALTSDVNLATALLDRGAAINKTSSSRRSAWIQAGKTANATFIHLLHSRGANTREQTEKGWTALHHAVQNENREAIGALIDIDSALLKMANSDGMTPLVVAVDSNRSIATIKLLVEAGAPLNPSDNNGRDVLGVAAKVGRAKVIAFLVKSGAAISTMDKNGWSAIHYAAAYNQTSAIKQLLKLRSGVGYRTMNGLTPLDVAIKHGSKEAAALLSGNQATVVDQTDPSGVIPLHTAITNRQLDMIELLLSKGANINAVPKNPSGLPALHLAVSRNQGDIVSKLLDCRAQINLKNGSGQTALHVAIRYNSIDALAILLRRGASLCEKDAEGFTALHTLTGMQYSAPIVDALRPYLNSSNLECRDNKSLTPLIRAAATNNTGIVSMLVKAGADLNAKAASGWSATHWALHHNNQTMLIRLSKDSNKVMKDPSLYDRNMKVLGGGGFVEKDPDDRQRMRFEVYGAPGFG